jgi:hypothetical protein
MADIDLKTETPDTTLPSDGFVFGADSQSAAAPSVYPVQSVATTLLGSTTLNGATVTADAPVWNFTQTWNNAGVTFTGLKANITDTASNASSLLMDLQTNTGGAPTSRFSVSKAGLLTVGSINGGGVFASGTQGPTTWATGAFSFSSTGGVTGTPDTFLTRRGAANFRLGQADAAAPVAQTLSVQSVSAGTTNTAGADLTITGSQGTGTGAGGSIVFQVAPAGSSGTAQNALATALTINSAQQAIFADGSNTFPSIRGSDGDSGVYFSGNNIRFSIDGTLMYLFEGGGNLNLRSSGQVRWTQGGDLLGLVDLALARDAANTLALRNGTNAQTFNVYNTYTDASNYERLRIFAQSAGSVIIGTEKGSGGGTARGLEFQTDGVTRLTINATNGDLTLTGAGISGPAGGVWGSPSVVELTAGGHLRWAARSRIYSNADGVLALLNSAATAGSSLEMTEMTAPSAPAANGVRIYAEDDGAGKTRLMALFATGAAQQIAIEP